MRHERNPFACLPTMAGKLVNTIIELIQVHPDSKVLHANNSPSK